MTGVLTVEDCVVATLSGSPPGHGPSVAGHALAADTALAGARLLAIADVICSTSDAPEAWLARYPGCAVAVTTAGDRLLAATRVGQPLRFSSVLPNDEARDPLVIALFLHAWLSAGHSPNLLEPRRLTTRAWLSRTCMPRSFVLVTESR